MNITIQISNTEIGTKRQVIFEGINSMSHENKTANIVWCVQQIDEQGELLDPLTVNQSRKVITNISDANRVTQEGNLIDRPDFETDEAFQEAFDNGYPEYSYWWNLINQHPLPVILNQAAQILNSFNRFDKP